MSAQTKPRTVGELKSSGYQTRSIKDELRSNLLTRLAKNTPLFPGIVGYDDSVIPQIVNAILARQNFILLGLRGQAKSRIIRQLVTLLDERIPVLRGSEVNDDPLEPISKHGRMMLEECGDSAPIDWVEQDARFVEKLATPDVTMADIIGDVDPIRAARGGHILADELTIHFGLLPRANRGIFAVNELPDLAGKIQVGLFNIMQEGDIQIKGYPVRMPLDVMLVFTANPEDYTARGKIITPLKDRIGAEIMTHYPDSLEIGMSITKQEAWLEREGREADLPEFISEMIERVAFLAREDKRIDQRSGVSQRLPISVLESVVSNAERRAFLHGESPAAARAIDLYAALPSMTGKFELEYEGELVGADKVAREIVAKAAGDTFRAWGGEAVADDIEHVVTYFDTGSVLQLGDGASAQATLEGFRTVPSLVDVVLELGLARQDSAPHMVAACELVLEALVADRRISRSDAGRYARAPRRTPPGGMPPKFVD
jgi:magnesium chelatase subunit I